MIHLKMIGLYKLINWYERNSYIHCKLLCVYYVELTYVVVVSSSRADVYWTSEFPSLIDRIDTIVTCRQWVCKWSTSKSVID